MIINSYILTYFVLSLLALLAGIGALGTAIDVLFKWKTGETPEEQDRREKTVYLAITMVGLCFVIRLVLVPLWFFALQSLVPSIPGAMCLVGVHLACTPYSFISTALKFVMPMAYGYWLAINALDRKIESQPLMKRKLYTLVPVSVLMFAETFSDLRFMSGIRPRLVDCCSSLFDDSSTLVLQKMTYTGWGWVIAFFVLAIVLLAVMLVLLRRPAARARAMLWLLGPATLIAFVLALHTRLSPLFLHARFHHCIFCIWQKLPETAVATACVAVACWTAVILAGTRSVRKFEGAESPADTHARKLLAWGILGLTVGSVVLAFRIVREMAAN